MLADRYVFDMERYRRIAIETIGRRTGVEAEFGRIELDLGLSPRITILDAVLRDPDAAASVSQASVSFDLSGILERKLRIVILIDGLDVRAPGAPTDARRVTERIIERWRETAPPDSGPSTFNVALDRIQAKDVRVYLGEDDDAFAVIDARVDDVLSDEISIAVDGNVPGAGDRAKLNGDVVLALDPADELPRATGYVSLVDAALERLPWKNAPAGTAEARVTFESKESTPGATLYVSLNSPNRPALTGDFGAEATWSDDALHVSRVSWESEDARIAASGSFSSVDDWGARVEQARFSEDLLDALLAMAERPRVRFEAESGAFAELTNFEAAPTADGPVRLVSGEAAFAGIAAIPTLDGTEMRAARGIHGSLRVAGNVIEIEEIETKSARISGSLTPDFSQKSVRVVLQGEANLAQLPWDALDVTELHRLEGGVSLTRFEGTISGEGLADDFVLDGQLRHGAIVYADEDVNIDIRNATGQFATNGSSLETSLNATIEDELPVLVSGAYDMQDRRWRGTLDVDASLAVPAILSDDINVWAAPIAASVGASIADIEIALLTADRKESTIGITRRGEGEMNAQLSFVDGTRLGVVAARGSLPVEALLSESFESMTGTGRADVSVRYDAPRNQLALSVDATNAAIATESVFRKAAGAGLEIELDTTVGREFALKSLEVRVDGVPAIVTRSAPQNGVIPLEVDMPLVVPLLVEGASASGTILVRYDNNATAAELNFVDVSLKAGEQLSLDRVHGPLFIFQRGVSSDGLEVRGARSDCTLRLAKVGDQWMGGLDGAKFDVNAVAELAEAAQTFIFADPDADPAAATDGPSAGAAPSDAPSYWEDPWLGEFVVSLNEVYFNRGKISNVRFRVLADDQAVRFRDVSVQPASGQLTASVALVPDAVEDVALKLSMNATELDARAINDLLWSENKDFFGTITGSLEFSGPLDDLETMLARGDGSVKWHGTRGSLGQTGFATKLLTALKTTDILNLRLRSLRDKGMTYDTWDVDIRMTDGVAKVHDFFLDGGAYTMQSDGTIDFAAQKTDALVYVRPLESVGNALRRVPIIGSLAAAVTTDLLGVPVKFTGSPYDPEVSVAKELLKDLATTPIRAGQGAVKSVTGGSDDSRGRRGSPENSENARPADPEPPREAPSPPNDLHESAESIASEEPSAW